MAKKTKKAMQFESTLIYAYDTEGSGFEPKSIFLFIAIHDPDIRPFMLKNRIGAAFLDWARTKEGREYVEENGVNWGDATFIPTEFLAKHGIYTYENAEGGTPGLREVKVSFHNDMVVDHNDSLFNKHLMDQPGKDEDEDVTLPNR